jgi:hypothetical protein
LAALATIVNLLEVGGRPGIGNLSGRDYGHDCADSPGHLEGAAVPPCAFPRARTKTATDGGGRSGRRLLGAALLHEALTTG